MNEEIRAFRALGRSERIHCLIVAGEPNASRKPGGDAALECLPPALFESGGGEPLACDIRPGQDDRTSAKLKLLAALLGVSFDELRQREQAHRQRQLAVIAAASLAGFLGMAGLAGFALVSRAEAVRQRDIARQKTLTAERTVTFVKSLFTVSDPSEARGQTITAREILDRGARELDQSLAGEPTVKAELSTTLGEVYGGLGLLRQSKALIGSTLNLPGVDAATRARQYAALSEAQWRDDDFTGALASGNRALALLSATGAAAPGLESRARLAVGDAQSRLGDTEAARRNVRMALAADLKSLGPNDPQVALDYEVLGDIAYYAGDLAEARRDIAYSLAIRTKVQGTSHPLVADDLNTLASIAYAQHDNVAAERDFRRALASYEAVLGPDHPLVAGALNNVGRTLIERQAFAEAAPLLRRAVAINLAQKADTADAMVFEYANLGIAERGLGHAPAADALFAKAEVAARLNKHRNLAPILVERAEIACDGGDPGRGLRLTQAARPIMAATYKKDAWRVAWTDVVRGHCLARAGQRAAGEALIAANAPIVRSRWSANTLYGARLARIVAGT